jgi:hypothetical protein
LDTPPGVAPWNAAGRKRRFIGKAGQESLASNKLLRAARLAAAERM